MGINLISSCHVETVVCLSNKNARSKDYVEIGLDVEDYYRIKDALEPISAEERKRMNKTDLYRKLSALQDQKYRDMQIKIIPTVEPESVIGVRTPELKSIAKDILKDGNYKGFLEELPHRYFEENQLHSFIISGIIDLNECM